MTLSGAAAARQRPFRWAAPTPPPVRVWSIDLAVDETEVDRLEWLLTPQEQARARRGTDDVRRRRVVLRAGLRTILGRELGLHPERVPLGTTAAGRPLVHRTSASPPVQVSCSASGDVGLVAISRHALVGVDVERIAPWSADVLDEGWLAPQEQASLAALPASQRASAVTRSWTQKEAVLKGRGTGLAGGPVHVITPVGRSAGTIEGWTVRAVPVPPGHVATVAWADPRSVPGASDRDSAG